MLAIASLPSRVVRRGSLLCLSCHRRADQRIRHFSVTSQRPCASEKLSNIPSPPPRRRSGLSVLLQSRSEAGEDENYRPSTLPDRPARTRFAPSPTGYLHVGGLRTALYNYLLAKATNGQFILRIEDTDTKRTVPDAQERLIEDLKWARLEWDEGPDMGGPYGPYAQSQRLGIYESHVNKLLESGHVYRCFCTPADLERQRETNIAQGLGTGYPGTCRNLDAHESARRAAADESHCIRFKVGSEPVSFVDRVYGHYQKKEEEGGDFIVIKRDGYPTYHFANVVDDHLMGITHVIRGEEWLISTPKHVALYRAFGWDPPEFCHVGLLGNEKGKKLSKRDMDTDVAKFRPGVLPEPLLAWLAQLGSHFSDPKVNTMDGLVRGFTNKFTKGKIKINPPKLVSIQQHYLDQLFAVPLHKFGTVDTGWRDAAAGELTDSLTKYVRGLDARAITEVKSSSGRTFDRSQWGSLIPHFQQPFEETDEEPYPPIVRVFQPGSRPSYPLMTDYVLESPHLYWTPPKSSYDAGLVKLLGNVELHDASEIIFRMAVMLKGLDSILCETAKPPAKDRSEANDSFDMDWERIISSTTSMSESKIAWLTQLNTRPEDFEPARALVDLYRKSKWSPTSAAAMVAWVGRHFNETKGLDGKAADIFVKPTLRWALAGDDELSVTHGTADMWILGIRETLRRLERAEDCLRECREREQAARMEKEGRTAMDGKRS